MFIYEQSSCGFESRYSHLHSRYGDASSKKVLDIQAKYRVKIHSKTRTWHGNNIRYVLTFRNNIRFSWKYADINKSMWDGTWIQYIFLKTAYFFLLSTLFQHYPRNSFRLVWSEVYLETYQTSVIELFLKKLSQNWVN